MGQQINQYTIDRTTFGDDDYFSGIVDEHDKLQYFFEIHKVKKNRAIKFNESYPVIFVTPPN